MYQRLFPKQLSQTLHSHPVLRSILQSRIPLITYIVIILRQRNTQIQVRELISRVTVIYLLTSKEEQDVPSHLLTHVYLYDCADGSLQVVSLWLWGVKYLHRVCAARDIHQRCVVKILLHTQNQTCNNVSLYFYGDLRFIN